ncbi:hypothetical protein IAT38_003360 [Cryptococcus sp. DSM 104549]
MPDDAMDIDPCAGSEGGGQAASEISITSQAALAMGQHSSRVSCPEMSPQSVGEEMEDALRVEMDRVAGVSGSEVGEDSGRMLPVISPTRPTTSQSTTFPPLVLNSTLHRLLHSPFIAHPSVQLLNLSATPYGRLTSPTHVQAQALAPLGSPRGTTPQHVLPPRAGECTEDVPLRTTSHSPRLMIEYPGPLSTAVCSSSYPSPEVPAGPAQDQPAQRLESEPMLVDLAPSPQALSPVLESDIELPDPEEREDSPAEIPRQATQGSKKRQLDAMSPVGQESPDGVDVFASGWGGEVGKRQKTAAASPAEEEEMGQDQEDGGRDSKKGGEAVEASQWKVGKTPGHQGSHSRAAKRLVGEGAGESEGKKRSLNESIAGAAERVLKKPFRPPTRISLPAARPKSSPRYGASSPVSALAHATSSTLASPDRPSSPTFPEFKSSPLTSRVRSAKLARPFKTPIRAERSTAPSPSTTTSTPSTRFPFPLNLNPSTSSPSSSTSTPCVPTAQAAQATITSLQNEVLVLRKALKYDTEDSRGRLEVLIKQWRAAGREMVERLFGIIPQPLDSPFGPAASSSTIDAYAFTNTAPGYSHSPFWDDPPTSSSLTHNPTPEVRDLLARAPRNEDGEPVDDEGVSLVPDVREDDLERMFEGLRKADEAERRAEASPSKVSHRPSNSSSSKRHASYTSSRLPEVEPLATTFRDADHTSSLDRDPDDSDNGNTSTAWDYAALMRGLGVDPPLLGWDAHAEDWADMDV